MNHDDADFILGMDRLIEEIVLIDILKNSSEIRRLSKKAIKLLETPKKSETFKVKKWLRTGELSGKNRTPNKILEECGRLLDDSCSFEILGEVAFIGTNGKSYVITTEAVIQEANPEYIKNLTEER